ncbi:MAG: phosphoserine phosphatase SerB [Hyphomonas sp.]|nr:phosphoserine phosphatase SerB [Hyphomonas sp.]OUX89331.1 MAG: phosphoserine phosphatase SerB [Hyphomonas sp. TMED31]
MILVAAANAPEDNIASRLSMILRDIAPATRVEAITSLGQMGDVAAVEAIIPTLPSEMLQPVLSALHEAEMDAAFLPGENRRKRLLISDMDSTIIGQECLDELADFAGLKAEVSAITERAMRGELDFEGALTTRVAMLKGLDLKALQDAYDARITLNTGAKTLVETMKANGAVTVLVSGGFTFFTGRVAEEAGFVAHRGNTLIDDGAALTGEVGLPILGREAKLSALDEVSAENGLGRADAIALGDGANDLAMIKAAGLGIAYKAKPIVAAEAHAAITHTDLHTALFFQGYHVDEFVTG